VVGLKEELGQIDHKEDQQNQEAGGWAEGRARVQADPTLGQIVHKEDQQNQVAGGGTE
jgi:hypothetical protein